MLTFQYAIGPDVRVTFAAVLQQVDLATESADPMGVDSAFEDACRDACGL